MTPASERSAGAPEDASVSERSIEGFVRRHLAIVGVVTLVTGWLSYAYFHIDEYFQVLEWTRFHLDQVEAWALPWEHASRMRPWLQPFAYWLVGRALEIVGSRDPFALACVCRLVTGALNVAALALFLRTALPWLPTLPEKRVFVRLATLLGFLPYLFVRTSSEAAAIGACTAAFAILLRGAAPDGPRTWSVPALGRPMPAFVGGLLFGVAFEARYQTAILALGVVAWLRIVGRASLRAIAALAFGGGAMLVVGALVDRWGYGTFCFPAFTYFQANILEGASGLFGADPPFAYFWMLPANLFAPIVVVLLLTAVIGFYRAPRHPITWAALPFFVVHNLIAHKEERFLFPLAILSAAFIPMAFAPSAMAGTSGAGSPSPPLRAGSPVAASATPMLPHRRGDGLAAFVWSRRDRGGLRALVVVLALWNGAVAMLLAVYPIGWNHHVPFARFVEREMGSTIHAHALPEFDLGLPAFHPRTYDIEKADASVVAQRLAEGTAKPYLIVDDAVLHTGEPAIDEHAVLVYTELPFADDPARRRWLADRVAAYNAYAKPPLRPVRYRSLYRLVR